MSRDLTRGDFSSHMIALAPAAVGLQLLLTGFEVVDAYWIGRTQNAVAGLAALGVGTYCLWCLFALGIMVETAVIAIGGREIGARDDAAARRTSARGLVFAALLGVVTVALGWPIRHLVIESTAVSGDAHGAAAAYLEIVIFGAATIYGFCAIDAAFRARGDTRTPLLLLLLAFTLNFVLDPVLIVGMGPIPAFGVAGAAWATVTTRLIAVVAGAVILHRRGFAAFGEPRALLDPKAHLRFFRVGAPASIGGFVYCISFLGLVRILARYGDDAVGAFALGQKIEAISWSMLVGVSMVTTAWMGQNIGAGHIDRARFGAWRSVAWAAVVSVVASAIFVLGADVLLELFAPGETRVHEFGRDYLFIVAVGQFALAVEIVLFQAFAGAGDTVPPMIVLSVFTIARIPIAEFLSTDLNWGADGVFWAVTMTTITKALILAYWFRRGSWERRAAAQVPAIEG